MQVKTDYVKFDGTLEEFASVMKILNGGGCGEESETQPVPDVFVPLTIEPDEAPKVPEPQPHVGLDWDARIHQAGKGQTVNGEYKLQVIRQKTGETDEEVQARREALQAMVEQVTLEQAGGAEPVPRFERIEATVEAGLVPPAPKVHPAPEAPKVSDSAEDWTLDLKVWTDKILKTENHMVTTVKMQEYATAELGVTWTTFQDLVSLESDARHALGAWLEQQQ